MAATVGDRRRVIAKQRAWKKKAAAAAARGKPVPREPFFVRSVEGIQLVVKHLPDGSVAINASLRIRWWPVTGQSESTFSMEPWSSLIKDIAEVVLKDACSTVPYQYCNVVCVQCKQHAHVAKRMRDSGDTVVCPRGGSVSRALITHTFENIGAIPHWV